MATMLQRFMQRIRACFVSQDRVNMPAFDRPGDNTRAKLPDNYTRTQAAESVRSFNIVHVERIDDDEAISNQNAREARRAVVIRPMQF